MTNPESGPYLFDTSADSWLDRSVAPDIRDWMGKHIARHPIHVSAITVMERIRGFTVLCERQPEPQRASVLHERSLYLAHLGVVHPVDATVALLAGELAAVLPQPPSPLKRSHRLAESRSDRLFRWRCDILIAATAVVSGLALIHHNPQDFETIRMAIEIAPQRFPGFGPLNLVSVLRLAAP